MSTEHQFVVRDFLGLGNLESNGHREEIGSSGATDEECQGKLVSPVDAGAPSTNIQNMMVAKLLSLHKNSFGGIIESAAGTPNINAVLNTLAYTGMKQVPISELQSHANNTQSSGLCTQTNWYGSSSTNNGAQPHEEGQPFATVASWIPKVAGSPPFYSSNVACPVLGVQAKAQTRAITSEPPKKQSSAQLTIFYNGSVNVYDDIPADKAQAIMLIASSGGPLPAFNAGTAQSRPATEGVSAIGILNIQNTTDQAVQTSPSVNQQPEFAKPTPCVAPGPLPAGQPVVPRALPQARKASLARFLEKRKERVQSKSPYTLTKPEQLLLPGFLSLNHNTSAPSMDKKLMPISFGMEEMPDPVSVCDSLSATGS